DAHRIRALLAPRESEQRLVESLDLLRDALAHTIRENPDIPMERFAAGLPRKSSAPPITLGPAIVHRELDRSALRGATSAPTQRRFRGHVQTMFRALIELASWSLAPSGADAVLRELRAHKQNDHSGADRRRRCSARRSGAIRQGHDGCQVAACPRSRPQARRQMRGPQVPWRGAPGGRRPDKAVAQGALPTGRSAPSLSAPATSTSAASPFHHKSVRAMLVV